MVFSIFLTVSRSNPEDCQQVKIRWAFEQKIYVFVQIFQGESKYTHAPTVNQTLKVPSSCRFRSWMLRRVDCYVVADVSKDFYVQGQTVQTHITP